MFPGLEPSYSITLIGLLIAIFIIACVPFVRRQHHHDFGMYSLLLALAFYLAYYVTRDQLHAFLFYLSAICGVGLILMDVKDLLRRLRGG